MRTIGKYLVALAGGFLLLLYSVHGGLSMTDFNTAFIGIRSDQSLNGIPVTFKGALDVSPKGRQTKDLYTALMLLAEKYGMRPDGDGAIDGVQWQVQIYCRGNYIGSATTARRGELILFQTSPYGFKEVKNYEAFNAEIVALMGAYGKVHDLENHAPITQKELLVRGRFMKMDVTSKCSPHS